jgi:hypothetical protein
VIDPGMTPAHEIASLEARLRASQEREAELTRERDEWKRRATERRQVYARNVGELLDRAEAAETTARKLRSGFEEIKRDYGRVCDDFELCTHVSCQSSVGAWMIADQMLSELKENHNE